MKINPKIKFLIYGVPEIRKKLLASVGRKENLIMLESTDSDKKLGLFILPLIFLFTTAKSVRVQLRHDRRSDAIQKAGGNNVNPISESCVGQESHQR